MLLVMPWNTSGYIYTYLPCFPIELWNIYWKRLFEDIMQMFELSALLMCGGEWNDV